MLCFFASTRVLKKKKATNLLQIIMRHFICCYKCSRFCSAEGKFCCLLHTQKVWETRDAFFCFFYFWLPRAKFYFLRAIMASNVFILSHSYSCKKIVPRVASLNFGFIVWSDYEEASWCDFEWRVLISISMTESKIASQPFKSNVPTLPAYKVSILIEYFIHHSYSIRFDHKLSIRFI